MANTLPKGARITGAQRGAVAAEYARRYGDGESIRSIAESAGRSYGFVHGVLSESGVVLRGRGGATRGQRSRASKAGGSAPAAGRAGQRGGTRAAAPRPAE